MQRPLLFCIILTVSSGLQLEVMLRGRGMGREKQGKRWVVGKRLLCKGSHHHGSEDVLKLGGNEVFSLTPAGISGLVLPAAFLTGMGVVPSPSLVQIMPLLVPSFPSSSHSCVVLLLQTALQALPASCPLTGEALVLGMDLQDLACAMGQRWCGAGQVHHRCSWELWEC